MPGLSSFLFRATVYLAVEVLPFGSLERLAAFC